MRYSIQSCIGDDHEIEDKVSALQRLQEEGVTEEGLVFFDAMSEASVEVALVGATESSQSDVPKERRQA